MAADLKDQPGRGLPPGPAGGANHAGPGGGRIINVASMTFFGSEQIPPTPPARGGGPTHQGPVQRGGRGQCQRHRPGMVTQLTADMQGKNPAQYAEITGRIPMHRWGPAGGPPGGGGLPGQPGGGLCHRRHPAGGRRLPGEVRIHRNFPCNPANSCEKGMNPWGFVD